MYGQADRTSLAVYVLREGSHVVHGRTDPSLMEYREGSDVVLDWHCMDGRIESLIASTGSLRQGLRTTLKDASLHSFCTEKQEEKEKEREGRAGRKKVG